MMRAERRTTRGRLLAAALAAGGLLAAGRAAAQRPAPAAPAGGGRQQTMDSLRAVLRANAITNFTAGELVETSTTEVLSARGCTLALARSFESAVMQEWDTVTIDFARIRDSVQVTPIQSTTSWSVRVDSRSRTPDIATHRHFRQRDGTRSSDVQPWDFFEFAFDTKTAAGAVGRLSAQLARRCGSARGAGQGP